MPVELFAIAHLTPGITVFGLSFMTLFSATLIAKDRESSLLQRLYITPLKAKCVICYVAAVVIGLEMTVGIVYAVVCIIPISILYIALGLLCGSVFTDKQVGGVCGALLTNLSAWVSGIWFDLDLVGGVFKKISYALPFVHAVDMERAVLTGNYSAVFPHLWWVLGYALILVVLAIGFFLGQMKKL